jgi:hypothetical protein
VGRCHFWGRLSQGLLGELEIGSVTLCHCSFRKPVLQQRHCHARVSIKCAYDSEINANKYQEHILGIPSSGYEGMLGFGELKLEHSTETASNRSSNNSRGLVGWTYR